MKADNKVGGQNKVIAGYFRKKQQYGRYSGGYDDNGLFKMSIKSASEKRHGAWTVFIGVCLFNFLGYGLIINCFGMFLRPVSLAQDISITQMSLTHTVRTICGTLGTLIAGQLMPRVNLKKYLSVVCGLLGAAAIITSLSQDLWQFILSAMLLGVATGLGIYTLVPLVITQWFEKPGGYIGIATACGGAGGIVFSPILAYIIKAFGWQAGYYLIFGVVIFAMLPVSIFMIHFSPYELGLEPYLGKVRQGEHEQFKTHIEIQNGYTLKEAAKKPVFYIIILFFIAVSLVSGIYTHIPMMLQDKGITEITSGYLNSCYQLGAAAAQFLIGILSVKWGMKRAMGLFMSLIFAGTAGMMLSSGPNILLLGVCLLFMGGGRAIGVVVGPLLVREAFGQKHYSSIFSGLYMAYLTSAALTTTILGAIYDTFNSYLYAYIAVIFCAVVVIASTFTVLTMIKKEKKDVFQNTM